jgi:hypothetical protein
VSSRHLSDEEVAADDGAERSETVIALRRPDVPVTVSELAALKGEALEVIEARVQILETIRKAALRATHPEDWVLFKAPEEHGGQIVGYLQDSGADRVRDLYGIEVFGVSQPEKISTNDPAVFHYVISGSGRCRLTLQAVEAIEGGRSSTDDFCKGKTGAELELAVRKAARANLDGNITRELAGLKSVPIDALKDAWAGTKKTVEQCRRGRGFGSRVERLGQRATQEGETREAPKCGICGAQAVFRPAGKTKTGKSYDAFWACPKSDKHPNGQKWTLDDAKWREQLAARTNAVTPTPAAPAAAATPADRKPVQPVEPLHADDIPWGGGEREPGEDDQ